MKKAKKLLSEVFALAMMLNSITVNVHAEEPTTTEDEPNVIVEEKSEENQPAEIESNESLTEAIVEGAEADNALSQFFDSSESENANNSTNSNEQLTVYETKVPIVVPVGKSVTKSDVPTRFTDRDNPESVIEITPENIDHFETLSSIFELSEDGQAFNVVGTSVNPDGTAVTAYLNNANAVCLFYVRAVVAAEEFNVSPETYVPLIENSSSGSSNSVGTVTNAADSITDDTSSGPDYINDGGVHVDMYCYPYNATYDVSIIDDNVTYGWTPGSAVTHDVSSPNVKYHEESDPFEPTAYGYGILQVSKVSDVTLQYTYFDANGNAHYATSEVRIINGLPYADFGTSYTYHYFWTYEKADGSMYYMPADENGKGSIPIQLNVGEAVHFRLMQCIPDEDVLGRFAYPSYRVSREQEAYSMTFPEDQQQKDIVAIDNYGNLTGANPGQVTIGMDYVIDAPIHFEAQVVVVDGDPTTVPGTDSFESYSIKHLKNNYWDPYEEPEYLGDPAQNPKVYNCLSGDGNLIPHLYQLEMKRSTTGKSFTVNDAAIIAQMETLVPSFRPEDGPSYEFCFQIKSYNTEVSSTESGLSSETTVLFEAVLPGSVRLKLDDTLPLTLNSVFVGTAEAGVADYSNEMDPEVAETLQGKIKSPADSLYGLNSSDLISSIPADILDQSEQSYSKIETSMKCTVEDFDSNYSNAKLELTPQYTLYDENGLPGEPQPLTIDRTVTVSVVVGDLYESGPVKIKHTTKDGTVYYYDGTVSDDGILTFENPHGFSDFEITETPAFAKHSLVLSGEIGVNFLMELPNVADVDYNESYMDFTVSGKTVRVDFAKSKSKQIGDKTYRVFTCYVNVLQMAESIAAEFHYGNEKILDSYSVKKYIDKFVNLTGYLDEDKALANAISDYGYHSQCYLAKIHKLKLGKNGYAKISKTDKYYYPDRDKYYNEAKNGTSEHAIIKETNNDIEKVTFSLDLLSSTSIFVYFKPADGYTGSFEVSVDGNTVEPEYRSDGRYLVKITGIPAHKLDEKHTIIVTTEDGPATTIVSALSYVYEVLSNETITDYDFKNCVTSIYYYYLKTMEYRAAHPETYN